MKANRPQPASETRYIAAWRAACRKTAATMRNAAERIVKNGQATCVTVIDGKRWRIGADLLDPSEMGYIPLFEEPLIWLQLDADIS